MGHDAGFVILFSPVALAGIIYTLYNWIVYRKIKESGVAGYGRLISCKRYYASPTNILIPRYDPIIEFYYAEKRYEIRAMGSFGRPPVKVGEEIAILFLEKYTRKVIISSKDMNIYYALLISFCLALCIGVVHMVVRAMLLC